MKVFQCSSGGMVPTIPTAFPSCYSLQTAASTQDSDYPGIFPLSASYPLDSSASHSLVQSSPAGDSPTTARLPQNQRCLLPLRRALRWKMRASHRPKPPPR